MRVRSEWLTLFTVTAIAAGALFLRGGSSEPAPAKHPDLAAGPIDFTPVGTTHPLTSAHPMAKGSAAHGKASPARP